MIQRIQTVYMLITAAFMALTLFLPIVSYAVYGSQFELRAFALQAVEGEYTQSTIYMGVLLAMSTVLPLITIFLYKHRVTQVRLLGVEAVLLFGDVVFMVIYYLLGARLFAFEQMTVSHVSWIAVAPAVGFVLTLMAIRAVLRDELLVRSLDRIR